MGIASFFAGAAAGSLGIAAALLIGPFLLQVFLFSPFFPPGADAGSREREGGTDGGRAGGRMCVLPLSCSPSRHGKRGWHLYTYHVTYRVACVPSVYICYYIYISGRDESDGGHGMHRYDFFSVFFS
jgi:hypothetical protein